MEITKIIYNEVKHETTVYFRNGDSVKVKKSRDTEHDIYSAVSAAVVKYIYGSNTAFKKQLKNVEVINKTTINLRDTSIFGMLFDDVIEETEAPKQHKFKIGDKVKFGSNFFTNGGVGVVVDFNKHNINAILVKSKDFKIGHRGGSRGTKTHKTQDHLWFLPNDLELVEELEKPKPHKFKVGDKVKFEDRDKFPREQKGVGVVVEIDGESNRTHLIESEDIQEGHNGNGFEKGTYTSGNCWWFKEKHLQLIEKLEPFVEGEVVWFEDNKEKHYHLVRVLDLKDENSVWIKFFNEETIVGYVPITKLTRHPKYKSYTKD